MLKYCAQIACVCAYAGLRGQQYQPRSVRHPIELLTTEETKCNIATAVKTTRAIQSFGPNDYDLINGYLFLRISFSLDVNSFLDRANKWKFVCFILRRQWTKVIVFYIY